MKRNLVVVYFVVSFLLCLTEYTNSNLWLMAAYYAIVLLNLGNAARLIKKIKV